MITERRAEEGYGIGWDLVHLGQGLIALSLVWDLAAHAVNEIARLALDTGLLPLIGLLDAIGNAIIRPGFCEVSASPLLCLVFQQCIVTGFITYTVVKLVCWTEWVKEEIHWTVCWEEFVWYNPWSWVKTLVCVIKTAIRWVLKTICKWIEYVVLVPVIVCAIGGLLAAR
jgi:hypothetical protein